MPQPLRTRFSCDSPVILGRAADRQLGFFGNGSSEAHARRRLSKPRRAPRPLRLNPRHGCHGFRRIALARPGGRDLAAGSDRLNEGTTSPSAKGATRRWSSVDDFMREVANARIYEGIHYRHSTEVGLRMGRQIGEMASNALVQMPQ